jgi:hypothetical protein
MGRKGIVDGGKRLEWLSRRGKAFRIRSRVGRQCEVCTERGDTVVLCLRTVQLGSDCTCSSRLPASQTAQTTDRWQALHLGRVSNRIRVSRPLQCKPFRRLHDRQAAPRSALFCGAMGICYSNVFSRTVISGKGQRVFAGAEMHFSIVNIPAVVAEHR